MNTNKISHTLRNYREAKGLTKEQLANILELKPSDYSRIEDGSRPVPFKTMKIIFKRLDASLLNC